MAKFISDSISGELQFGEVLASATPNKSSHPNSTSSEISPSCIVFMSSCSGTWGGSEELWSATARYLRQQGHSVYVFKINVDRSHSRIIDLHEAKISITDTFLLTNRHNNLIKRILDRLGKLQSINLFLKLVDRGFRFLNRYLPARWHLQFNQDILVKEIKQLEPDLVVISQGDNFDGLEFASLCQQLKIPYAMLSHKAGEDRWPIDAVRLLMRSAFQEAKQCFFVSQHNQTITEKQISRNLPHTEVIRNPHLAPVTQPLPWKPPQDGWFKLACVGRLWLFDKGQDILLQVLAQDKWKSRRLCIEFFGEGVNRNGLIELAQFLEVQNVSFPGFVDDIVDVWREFHGLILPSRAEGLPISLVEAMMCGRLGIVTNVGGVSEVVTDNVTGFIAQAPCLYAIDEALERAWQRRDEWEQIGQAAACSIREIIPPNPEKVFAGKLLRLCSTSTITSPNGTSSLH
ncbi:MAG: glycosyltransferase family 4 protein [Leptolyngbyaceae cyanobacterium SL_7_1]|nr:glycosyltransferase family 4 protein [Leptolyngbyaceae cyanobacterium SL_7_1]